MRENPDKLDAVQRRIDKIMKARQQYIVLADNLIDVMEKEPENAQKKLEIIAQLESVEKHPTEEQLQFIRQAKIAAQFTYYRAQFRRITEEASQAVDRGEYTQAVSQIQKGFDMYKEEFYEENPASVTDSVTASVNKITSLCRDYSSQQDRLKNLYNDLIKNIRAGNYRESIESYNAFNSGLATLAETRNHVYRNAESLKKTFTDLQKKNPELTEASYLPFVFRFTLGLESNERSGIIGAMDTQYKNYVEGIKPVIYETVSKYEFSKIDSTNAATVKLDELPLTRLSLVSDFSSLGIRVNSLYDKIQGNFAYDKKGTDYIRSMEHVRTTSSTLLKSYEVLKKYQQINATLATIQKPKDAVEGIRSKNSYASQMIACSRDYDECSKTALDLLNEQWFVEYQNELSRNAHAKHDTETPSGIKEFEKIDSYYSVLNKSLYEICKSASQHQWKETALYFAEAATDLTTYYHDEYKKADELLEQHKPQEAIAQLTKIDAELKSDSEILTSCRDILLKSSIEKSSFAQDEKTVVDSVQKMNGFKTASQNTRTTCNEEILLSQRALNEAEMRYNLAVTSFKKNDYTQARKNIELASAKYKESLDHQDSDSLRSESDKKLFALGQQINDAENKLVVAEVRQLKNQAKNEYYNGNFEKAENLLARAKSRWAVTNGDEEDEEIKNLLALVETALSMKTGRVIPATAPLYPEMSQILSIAHQYFDQGSALIKKGEREKGIELLTQAKKKLQEVQLVYPLNQEASLLTLRIDQLIDPASFNEMFERKVKSAKESYKIASKAQQAYADLKDLAEIRPDYPGLKKLIYQVEIEIGVRQKPVDNTAIVRSQALTREAQQIVNSAGRNENQLKNAIAKLDQAIALNPNNDQAVLLKDRVQISLGGRASVVLSAADEAKYQQAIQELQKNNIVGAYALVEQLLQKAENRRSSKVLDLQKKVKALL